MENIIYNELVRRGYKVDVGVVCDRRNGKNAQKEIDFVLNDMDRRIYTQNSKRVYQIMMKIKRAITVILVLILSLSFALHTYAETKHESTTRFLDSIVRKDYVSYSMESDMSWFNSSSLEYDHNICRLSLLMATAAFKKEKCPLEENDEHLRAFFAGSGFESAEVWDYGVETTRDTVANGFACQKLRDSAGEYTLIAVAVCGQGYGNEWISNFTVGDDVNHVGFDEASDKVYDRLIDYIDEYAYDTRVKIWISGFSRAAAISNVLGHKLLTEDRFDPDGIFVYTFGTPNTTKEPAEHPQIFNICNGFDVVTRIPMKEWGYAKHGITLYLPTPSTSIHFDELRVSAEKVYEKIVGMGHYDIAMPERNWFATELLSIVCRFIPDNEIYTRGYQEALGAAVTAPGTVGDKLNTLIETARRNNCDTSGYKKIENEVKQIIDYSAWLVLHGKEDPKWDDVSKNQSMLVHEHFPTVYLSWIFSDNTPEELFGSNTKYTRIGIAGKADIHVAYPDADTGEEIVVHDSKAGIAVLPVVDFRGSAFIDLPSDESYKVTFISFGDDHVGLNLDVKDLSEVVGNAVANDSIRTGTGDTIEITVPAEVIHTGQIDTRLNGTEKIAFRAIEYDEIFRTDENTDDLNGTPHVKLLLTQTSSIMLDIIMLIVIVLALIVMLIDKFVHRKADDRTECNAAGRTLLIISSVLSGVVFIAMLILAGICLAEAAPEIHNEILRSLSQLLDKSRILFFLIESVLAAILSVMSIRSISHKRSRRNLLIISLLAIIITIIYLLMFPAGGIVPVCYLCYQTVPVLALIVVRSAGKSSI